MKPKQTFRGAVIKPGTKPPAAGESFRHVTRGASRGVAR